MNTAEELDTIDDSNEETVEITAPIGPAESQRLQLKQKAREKIAAAKEALSESREALKEVKAQVVQTGPQNMHLLESAKRACEHNSLCVEHYEAVLVTLDRPELLALVESWDRPLNNDPHATYGSLFLEDVAPEVEQLKKASKAFADALAGMHRKFNKSVTAASEANAVARSLAEHGIKVRVSPPTLVVMQQAASGALRDALVGAGLGIGDHWVKESLNPAHYQPLEALKGIK